MPPTRTSTSRSGTSEAASLLGAVTVLDARQNKKVLVKSERAAPVESSRTSAAAFSASGTIGHSTAPQQSRGGPGGLAPQATYAARAAAGRSPPSVAANSRQSVYNGNNARTSPSGKVPSVIGHGAPGMPDRYVPPNAALGDRFTPYNTGNTTNRSTAMQDGSRDRPRLPKEVFKRGLIIRGPLHEQDYQGTSSQSNYTVADNNRTESRFGPIHTKIRKMIVVECYQDHYIAVPLFTHGGRGLTKKQAPHEFIRLVNSSDSRSMSPLFLSIFEYFQTVDGLYRNQEKLTRVCHKRAGP